MTKTMKKILSVCLVVLMCMTIAPLDGFVGLDFGFGTKASAVYASGECGTNVKYSLDNGVLTINGTGPMKNYSTNESPFSGSTSSKITSVIINDGVTSIGNNAFSGCSSLKSVTIPNSVTSIGNNAFDCCTSLESVTIPNKVTSIGDSAFYYCKVLTSVTIPDSVTSIGDSAFSSCRALKSISIPNKVTKINSSTFTTCKALESVTIPNSVTTINNNAFKNCTSLKTVYYGGCSETMWNKITIGEENENLTAANRTYADHKCSYTANKNVITGTCNNCSGVVSATLTVDEAVPRTYTGYAIEPLKVECVNLNTKLEITYKNNINVGTASGSITIGGATATQTFEIEEEKSHTFGDVQFKNADCVNDGYNYKQCSICKKYFPSNAATNDTNGKDNIDDFKMEALGHLFIGGYHYKDAGCLNTGYDYKQCSICKKYFPSNADEKATNGKDNTDDFVIEAKGHTFGNTIEVKPASCLEDGVKTAYKQCSICKKYFPSNAATNDTNGKDNTDDFVIEATGHSFGNVQHKDADCLNTGYDYKQCTDCNKYFASDAAINAANGKDSADDFVIEATGHSFGTVQHKDADCLNTGYDYKQCTDCKKYFASDAAITDTNGKDDTADFETEATGHSFGTLQHKNADCVNDGYSYRQCSKCNKYFSDDAAINATNGKDSIDDFKMEALGHFFSGGYRHKDADCTNDGYDYKQCLICSKYFPTDAGEKAANGKDSTDDFVIEATGHSFGNVQHKNADCLSGGYDYKQCSTCSKYFPSDAAKNAANGKDSTDDFIINATGHSFGDTIEVKPASCLEDGVETAYKQCSICKKYFSSDAATNDTNGKGDTADFVIDATGHTFGTVQHKDADCLNIGYDYKQCTDCKKYFPSDAAKNAANGKDSADDFVIEATGHSFGTVQHKDADCLNTGYDYKQCTDCKKYFASDAAANATNGKDDTDDFVIEATGHTFGEVQHKNADCLSGGYDYKQCSNCSKYFAPDAATNAANGKDSTSTFTTQKLNHSYTGAVKSDGNGKTATHSYMCVNGCGQYGGATAHEWNDGEITTPASHVKEGVKTYKCPCGGTYTEPISKLAGHTYIPTVVDPTCTEQGYTEHKCACGDSYKDTYVDATGHDFKDGICANCGDKEDGSTGEDPTTQCDCLCHSTNRFVQFIYRIVRWFWKTLKWHKTCDCGTVHY